MSDIVTSRLPNWDKTRAWILARPLSGFAETFSQYIVEVAPGGGSVGAPDTCGDAESALYVLSGSLTVRLERTEEVRDLTPGGFFYVPPGTEWTVRNDETASGGSVATFAWVRKRYEKVDFIDVPDPIFAHDLDVAPTPMPDTDGKWCTTRFVDPDDLRHDMHLNVVTFKPGAVIPFEETHVMEHGIYVIQGKAVYQLNQDWVEVRRGDFLWLRAFCPQSCYAAGPDDFRYLLYKDVNRHPALRL